MKKAINLKITCDRNEFPSILTNLYAAKFAFLESFPPKHLSLRIRTQEGTSLLSLLGQFRAPLYSA